VSRHSWDGQGNTRTCQACGTEAVKARTSVSAGGAIVCGWSTTYTQGGRSFVADHVPPCGPAPEPTAPERAGQADHQAGLAWKAGELVKAARLIVEARELEPARADHWASRTERVNAAIRARNEPTRDDRRPLAEIVAERLAAHGVRPGDPDLEHMRAWNALQHERQADATAQPEPMPAQATETPQREAETL
jgi:hypothetical protein